MATLTITYNPRSAKAEKPNEKTLAAIKEAKSGKQLPKVDTTSVEAMISSILQ